MKRSQVSAKIKDRSPTLACAYPWPFLPIVFLSICTRSLRTTNPTKVHVRLAKTRIRLGVQWVAKDPRFPHVDSKDSDRTGRMPRLIWVFAGCWSHFIGFHAAAQLCIMQFKGLNDKRALTSNLEANNCCTYLFPLLDISDKAWKT